MAVANLHKVLNYLMDRLFVAENRRLTKWTDSICKKNQELGNLQPTIGFIYNGIIFRPSNVIGNPPHPMLNHALWGEMDALIKDSDKLREDKAMIRQSLVNVLGSCSSDQDVRDALPDCLAELIDHIRPLSRTRPEAYTVMNNDRYLKQYQKALPLMEVYSVSRMIF